MGGRSRMSLRTWTEDHEGLWQFVKFNVLSNISTITRFACAWAGTAVFVNALHLTAPFRFFVFDYSAAGSNGVGGFATFLVAEVLAQVVNYFVQMKWVFESDAQPRESAPKYAVLAVLIVLVNLVLPGHVVNLCQGTFGMGAELAGTVASAVNTLLAVIVSFPLLKYWIAREG